LSALAKSLLFVILAAVLGWGCGVQESAYLGKWEGVTENKYRVNVEIKEGGVAEISKIGVFTKHEGRWRFRGERIDVYGKDGLFLHLRITDSGLVDETGFRLTRPGPLAGFRFPALAAVIAMVVTLFATPLVRRLAFRFGAVDDPKRDDRRVHKEPLPRWGGIAIYIGFIVSLLTILPLAFPGRQPFPPYLLGMIGIGTLILVVGALDDLKQFSAKVQTAVLLLAGAAVTLFGKGDYNRVSISGMNWPPFTDGSPWIEFGLWSVPITAFYIFVITKTMDTIDGIDGLASGIAAIGGLTLSLIATYEGQPRVALVSAALAGSAVGFLKHNYNPSKIIMGTGGAQLLGFVLATLSIVGAMKTAAALMVAIPVLVFGVPLFDAIQVVIRRIISGAPITQADKRHIHHQLLEKGLTQRQAVLVLYAIAVALCALLVLAIKYYG